MSLRSVNLNLLPILQMLLKTGSVSRAAAALRLSQPAVSDALARLRVLVKDQLLLRIGGEMKLTPRAMELIAPLDEICTSLQLFFNPGDLELGSATRELVIGSADVCAYLFGRQAIELLHEEAPGTTLHLMEFDTRLCERMASREIDFAFLPEFALQDLAPAPLRFERLLFVDHVVMMWSQHPLATEVKLANDDFMRYPHIIFQPDAVITDPSRISFTWGGLDLKVAARVGQMLLIPRLLLGSNCLSVVPRPIADAMMPLYPVKALELPYPSESFYLGLAWSPVFDADPIHKWFRSSMPSRIQAAKVDAD